MNKRGILLDVIKGADTDNEGNLDPDVFVEASPFHDDHNDERADEDELLYTLSEDEDEGFGELPTGDAVHRGGARRTHSGGGDPSRMACRMALVSGHQTAYPEKVLQDALASIRSPIEREHVPPAVIHPDWASQHTPPTENFRIDFVDDNREAEKVKRAELMEKKNRMLDIKGYRWPDEWKDRPTRTIAMNREESAIGIGKPVPFFLKVVAQRIGADPVMLRWPRYMNDLTNAQITQVCERIKNGSNKPAATWNWVVKQLKPEEQFRRNRPKIALEHVMRPDPKDPRNADGKNKGRMIPVEIPAQFGSSIRRIPASVPEWEKPYIGNPVDAPGGIIDHSYVKDPMEFGVIMSEEWMEKVQSGAHVTIKNRETGEMETLVTRCIATGKSLVSRKERGFKHWVLAPNLWGMSIRAARLMVSAVALEAGLHEEKGKVNYPEGESGERLRAASKMLRDNPDAWCIIAVATHNREWRDQAMLMLTLRDRLYYGLPSVMWDDDVGDGRTVEDNQRELKRLQRHLGTFVN